MRSLLLCLAAMLLLVAMSISCAAVDRGQMQAFDPSSDDDAEVGGLRAIAARIAGEIGSLNWTHFKASPQIAVSQLDNPTHLRLDLKRVQTRLVRNLGKYAQGRIQFVSQDAAQAATLRTHFVLKGEVRSLAKVTRDGVADYWLFRFQLLDSHHKTVVWMADYETKKVVHRSP